MPLVRKSTSSSPPPPPPSESVLMNGTTEQRWSAARATTDVAALGRALAQETDNSVREAILTSLCRIATPESAGVVAAGVRSEEAQIRRGALDALISMPQVAAPYLPAMLSDPDPDVRLLSCEVVRALTFDQATALLSALLERETVPNVCTAAVDVLSEIGNEDALPALRTVARRFADEPFLQFAVQAAIERIADTSRG